MYKHFYLGRVSLFLITIKNCWNEKSPGIKNLFSNEFSIRFCQVNSNSYLVCSRSGSTYSLAAFSIITGILPSYFDNIFLDSTTLRSKICIVREVIGTKGNFILKLEIKIVLLYRHSRCNQKYTN